MKTSLRTAKALLLGALMTTGTFAFAQTETERSFEVATYPAANPLKLWMHVEKQSPDRKVRVTLLDKKNNVLYSQYLPNKARSYRQQFDMSEMKDGVYTLRISDGAEVIEKSFQLKTPGIQERLPQRLLTVVAPEPTKETDSRSM